MFYLFNLNNFNFIKPNNKISLMIFRFNIFLFVLIFSLFFLFFILLIFFICFYRKFLKNNIIFILNKDNFKKYLFFIIFVLIFILIFISTVLLLKIKKSTDFSYVTIKIIGYQWRWYYNYINGIGKNINYFSNIYINIYQILNLLSKESFYLQKVDNKLILPVNKSIRLIFTSNDVIHSWFIPSLILKQDAIPGFYRDFYFKSNNIGKYKGYCTELCGKYHSYMPIILNIVSLINYKKWTLSFYFKKFLNFNF